MHLIFTCAQSVAQDAAYDYAYNFLARRQYDGRQLRSVAPLGEERHSERL